MTVRELIEILEGFSPSLPVFFSDGLEVVDVVRGEDGIYLADDGGEK